MNVIAFDLGATKLSSAIFDEKGNYFHKKMKLLSGKQGKAVCEMICREITDLLEVASYEDKEIEAVGICVPGIANQTSKCVWAPNIPGWENYPLLSEVQLFLKANARYISVKVDSDRTCSLLGESWKGAAMCNKNVIFLAIGTGIGAGILIEGKILRGTHDIAGAIGWMGMHSDYCRKYDECGCFEYYASGEGIVRTARELLTRSEDYKGELISKDISTKEIFLAFERGDSLAKKVVQTAVHYWGLAAANFVSIFNPEKIIFGGGVFGPAKLLMENIKEEAKKWAQPISMQQVTITSSLLETNAGLFGAAKLAFGIEENEGK